MQTVQEIYQASIRPLGESEKLQIATSQMIGFEFHIGGFPIE